MKIYTLTMDTETSGREVDSFATMAEAEAALFAAIRKESECRGDLDALPKMESGDWHDAWGHAFPSPCDLAWIDEVPIPGEAIIPGTNPDAMELHEVAKNLEHAITYDVFTDAPECEDGIDEVISAMEQAANALHRAGRMIEGGRAPVSRIAVTVTGGVALIEDADNWPEGLELYLVDYDQDGADTADLEFIEGNYCSVSRWTADETSASPGKTGHFCKALATAWKEV